MTTRMIHSDLNFDPSPLIPFSDAPCLIYPASRPMESAEMAALLSELNTFLNTWASHGSPVTGAAAVVEDRFVVVAHRPMEIAGCSRDSLLFFMNQLGEKRGFSWVGGARVFYKDAAGSVVDVDRPAFRQLAAGGTVDGDTVVFDTTVRETAGVLNGKFAPQAKDSWHAKLIPAAVAAE